MRCKAIDTDSYLCIGRERRWDDLRGSTLETRSGNRGRYKCDRAAVAPVFSKHNN